MSFPSRRVLRTVAFCLSAVFCLGPNPVSASSRLSSVPSPVPDVPHGTLLSASLSPKSGPAGSKQYQLLYTSRSVDGAPIAVSGFAYLPTGTPPPDGWPVLSYAHGTAGLADRCAPSKKLGVVEQVIGAAFTAQGIAVVGTDYEGLGTPGRHPYLVGESEGRGVLDIVSAARQIPGESLSSTTLIWGHSQGGHAALFAGQLAKSWSPDLSVVGVVAGAPPSQLTTIADSLTNSKYRGYLFMVIAGMQAANPSLNIDDVLTEQGKSLLPVVDTGCNNAVFSAFNKDPLDALVKRDGFKTGAWAEALTRNEPGTTRIDAPVLMVHGTADEQIPVATSAKLLNTMCAAKTVVQRKTYKGQDHTSVVLASVGDILAFMIARLAGIPASSSCRKQ